MRCAVRRVRFLQFVRCILWVRFVVLLVLIMRGGLLRVRFMCGGLRVHVLHVRFMRDDGLRIYVLLGRLLLRIVFNLLLFLMLFNRLLRFMLRV